MSTIKSHFLMFQTLKKSGKLIKSRVSMSATFRPVWKFQTTFRPGLNFVFFGKGENEMIFGKKSCGIERAERVNAIFDVIFTFWSKIGIQKSMPKIAYK